MIKLAILAVVLTCLSGPSGHNPQIQELEVMPQLGRIWKQREAIDGADAQVPYRWCIYENAETGEKLSFASLAVEDADSFQLNKQVDSAFELFPNGNAAWVSQDREITIESLSWGIRNRTGASSPTEVLGFCFVSMEAGRDNLMAHGRAWVAHDVFYIVQHTSSKPISSEVVDEVAADYRRQIEQLQLGDGK